jgi:ELWxxDGT repeat protein
VGVPGVADDGPLVITSEIALGGDLIFVATAASGATELWVSNGTAAGTQQLNVGAGTLPSFFTSIDDLTVIGSTLYFVAAIPGYGSQVWSTQGAPGDLTQRMSYANGAEVGAVIAYDGAFYFTDDSPTYGPGVYSTVGSDTYFDGTIQVNSQPVIFDGKLLFEGDSALGEGLYLSNGNPADLTAPIPLLGSVESFTVSGADAFFVYAPPQESYQLWVTNGSTAQMLFATLPTDVTAFDGGVIFTGNGGSHQSQVWFSNGTTAGTYELYINQTLDHTPSLLTGPAISFDNEAYFIAGGDLYQTDGTTAGTSEVAPLGVGGSGGDTLLVFDNKLFVFADNGSAVASNGTAGGTVILNSQLLLNGDPQTAGDKLYFLGDFGIYATDGTTAGTSEIYKYQAQDLATAGGLVYFYADGVQGAEGLYDYNPATQATTLLNTEQVISFGPAVGSDLLYVGFDTTNYYQLWVTNGTAAGAQEINLNADITEGPVRQIDPSDLTLVNGLVYFDSQTNVYTGPYLPALAGLWVTDGTASGTHMVTNPDGGGVFGITADGTSVIFETGPNNTYSTDSVYSYDTTSGATTYIGPTSGLNFFTATDSTQGLSNGPYVLVAGGVAYFLGGSPGDTDLARADSGGGETLLTSATNGHDPTYATVVGSELFFVGTDSSGGEGLFVTDGTVAGTTLLTTFPTGFYSWGFNAVGTDLYFENSDAANGSELWISDGTVAGTHRVTDTYINGSANASDYVVAGSLAYFTAADGVHGQQLWSFNGSAGGDAMVTDINPGAGGLNPTELTAAGATLYFVGTAADGSSELWSTTGSGAAELTSPTNGAAPADLTVVGSDLYFFGTDAAHGAGLFVSNGTAAGTEFLGAFNQADAFSAVGSELYFNADTAEGWQLWKSNGTVYGTQQLTFGAEARDDFNADGKSDLLIENSAGVVVVGEVASGTAAYAAVTGLGPEWSFKGDGDFLGDGAAAFLIENTAGMVAIGEVSGGATSFTAVANLGPEWAFEGVGDFLGVGRDQFLIQNTAGAVAVGEVVNGQTTYTAVAGLGSEWSFEGVGDFLGDGKSDFLIENTAGAVVVGEVMNGQAAYTVVAGLGPEWKFVGAGDFLGDGQDDFLMQNSAGSVVIGEVQNGAAAYTAVTSLGPEWSFVGTGDYLGEGHDQFLIENTAGAVVVGDWTAGAIHFTQVASLGPEWAFH